MQESIKYLRGTLTFKEVEREKNKSFHEEIPVSNCVNQLSTDEIWPAASFSK